MVNVSKYISRLSTVLFRGTPVQASRIIIFKVLSVVFKDPSLVGIQGVPHQIRHWQWIKITIWGTNKKI